MTTSAEVRSHLIDALQLDLVGPTPDDAIHAEEILDQAPSKWYLTGFLVPYGAPVEERTDNSGDEDIDEVGRVSSGEDENIPEKAFARKAFFPSSMGLSVLLPQNVIQLDITVQWGDYQPLTKENNQSEQVTLTGDWQRTPGQAELTVQLRTGGSPTQLDLGLNLGNRTKQLEIPLNGSSSPTYLDVPNSDGLQLVISVRSVPSEE
ncbi:MAG: DISARM system helicase DrmA, partial [Nostoc sp.]